MPATADGPSALTGRPPALADEPVSFVVDSSRFPGGRTPADPYNYITQNECDNNYDAASDDAGWIKNRDSYCQTHLVYMPAKSFEERQSRHDEGKPSHSPEVSYQRLTVVG